METTAEAAMHRCFFDIDRDMCTERGRQTETETDRQTETERGCTFAIQLVLYRH